MVVARTKHLLMLTGLILITAVGSNVLGQQPDGQRPGAQRPGGQRPGQPGRGGPGFRGPGGGDPISLLQRPDVQAELELVAEQKREVRGLPEKFAARRREVFSEFSGQPRGEDLSDKERQARRERMQEAFRGLEKEVDGSLSFLLDHQRERLSQLEIQWKMRGGGGAGALASRELGEKLKITDKQREKLRTKGRELGREFRKKMAELQREFKDELLKELDPKQRKLLLAMVGEPFEFRDQGPGRPGGNRPGGGRPGNRPGGGRPDGNRPGGGNRPARPPSN
ncbi:MAG: hypothetical protein IH987_18610 [Planctomycetes bacterium]|nr:hypothetical protein [Planctomycetota bacterium]